MRALIISMIGIGLAGSAAAKDTLKTWRVGTSTICGFRQVGGRVERFIADETDRGLSYDFAPSDSKWRDEWCDRDPNPPPPSYESIIAQISKPRPSCAQLEATWAGMTHAQRLEIASLRARQHYDDGCKLIP